MPAPETVRYVLCVTSHRTRRLPQARLLRGRSRAIVSAGHFNVRQNMAEEVFYAPLANSRPIRLRELAAAFVELGRQATIQEGKDARLCWLCFGEFNSQLTISTNSNENRDLALVTFEFVEEDGSDFFVEVSDVMDKLGFSNDPEAQYK